MPVYSPPRPRRRPRRRRLANVAALACTAALVGYLVWAGLAAVQAQTEPRAIDGDTFRMGGTVIRLWGVDAPEIDQPCGNVPALAVQTLSTLLADAGRVQCKRRGSSYGRTVARCIADGKDIGRTLVRLGLAFDAPRYSHGIYSDAQAQARRESAGVWQHGCERPWRWRRAQ